MEATSITHTQDTLIELITQDVSDKIEKAGFDIQSSLTCGDIQAVTTTIRDVVNSLEDVVWGSCLKTVFECETVLARLRALGARKGLRFVSYPNIEITCK